MHLQLDSCFIEKKPSLIDLDIVYISKSHQERQKHILNWSEKMWYGRHGEITVASRWLNLRAKTLSTTLRLCRTGRKDRSVFAEDMKRMCCAQVVVLAAAAGVSPVVQLVEKNNGSNRMFWIPKPKRGSHPRHIIPASTGQIAFLTRRML